MMHPGGKFLLAGRNDCANQQNPQRNAESKETSMDAQMRYNLSQSVNNN